ncbi:hypothetical protein PR048_006240 [Dryococelus australis]|uniref:Uncharacterized protein n=1 Tax=Dryococelus australis TaxID=614101 RepID=A0ABQ9IAD2_9NEOP|nr:hypothetical protein PR048_006240 [Dryococelus australis]
MNGTQYAYSLFNFTSNFSEALLKFYFPDIPPPHINDKSEYHEVAVSVKRSRVFEYSLARANSLHFAHNSWPVFSVTEPIIRAEPRLVVVTTECDSGPCLAQQVALTSFRLFSERHCTHLTRRPVACAKIPGVTFANRTRFTVIVTSEGYERAKDGWSREAIYRRVAEGGYLQTGGRGRLSTDGWPREAIYRRVAEGGYLQTGGRGRLSTDGWPREAIYRRVAEGGYLQTGGRGRLSTDGWPREAIYRRVVEGGYLQTGGRGRLSTDGWPREAIYRRVIEGGYLQTGGRGRLSTDGWSTEAIYRRGGRRRLSTDGVVEGGYLQTGGRRRLSTDGWSREAIYRRVVEGGYLQTGGRGRLSTDGWPREAIYRRVAEGGYLQTGGRGRLSTDGWPREAIYRRVAEGGYLQTGGRGRLSTDGWPREAIYRRVAEGGYLQTGGRGRLSTDGWPREAIYRRVAEGGYLQTGGRGRLSTDGWPREAIYRRVAEGGYLQTGGRGRLSTDGWPREAIYRRVAEGGYLQTGGRGRLSTDGWPREAIYRRVAEGGYLQTGGRGRLSTDGWPREAIYRRVAEGGYLQTGGRGRLSTDGWPREAIYRRVAEGGYLQTGGRGRLSTDGWPREGAIYRRVAEGGYLQTGGRGRLSTDGWPREAIYRRVVDGGYLQTGWSREAIYRRGGRGRLSTDGVVEGGYLQTGWSREAIYRREVEGGYLQTGGRGRLSTEVYKSTKTWSHITYFAPAVAERLACSPPTKADWVQSPAGSLPDFHIWESCRTMPLLGGFSWGSPVPFHSGVVPYSPQPPSSKDVQLSLFKTHCLPLCCGGGAWFRKAVVLAKCLIPGIGQGSTCPDWAMRTSGGDIYTIARCPNTSLRVYTSAVGEGRSPTSVNTAGSCPSMPSGTLIVSGRDHHSPAQVCSHQTKCLIAGDNTTSAVGCAITLRAYNSMCLCIDWKTTASASVIRSSWCHPDIQDFDPGSRSSQGSQEEECEICAPLTSGKYRRCLFFPRAENIGVSSTFLHESRRHRVRVLIGCSSFPLCQFRRDRRTCEPGVTDLICTGKRNSESTARMFSALRVGATGRWSPSNAEVLRARLPACQVRCRRYAHGSELACSVIFVLRAGARQLPRARSQVADAGVDRLEWFPEEQRARWLLLGSRPDIPPGPRPRRGRQKITRRPSHTVPSHTVRIILFGSPSPCRREQEMETNGSSWLPTVTPTFRCAARGHGALVGELRDVARCLSPPDPADPLDAYDIPAATTRLPPMRTVFDSRRGHSRIFAGENRGGRCRWSAGFLGDLPFAPPFHSGASPYSHHFTLIGSQDLAVKNRPNLFIRSLYSQSVFVSIMDRGVGSARRTPNLGNIHALLVGVNVRMKIRNCRDTPRHVPPNLTKKLDKVLNCHRCRTVHQKTDRMKYKPGRSSSSS